ncbi:SDR family oxidoreductase [Aestuariicella hydrocarbonica]|uniref:SDR family oxidoreductase n=1 Tax=Pseudomaricurvus hydrocarbonicus TaxID=1470433 RepID=A0A9E5MNH4_9GAMM|nr:SDR family oxidoreductase [Aestuariicella hydrocarbonica]NHO67447.1 SDR family oxidoreductase [Aestuariicella hydrocarbonica]
MSQVENRKVALVTGAASGVGLAVARQLAETGFDLCLVDVDANGLEQAEKQVVELGAKALVQVVDLAVPDACTTVVSATVKAFARLDALCNVAAVMLPGHSTEVSVTAFQTTLAVNLSAPFFLAQAAIPHLLEVDGAIVNVASAVGVTAQAYNAAYCASKAGLIHMTKSLAMEYISQSIRINAVAPGGMMTPLAMNMAALQGADPKIMGRTTPLRGLVEVKDVAEMVVLLATDAGRGYHGACVVIDKGMCAG